MRERLKEKGAWLATAAVALVVLCTVDLLLI